MKKNYFFLVVCGLILSLSACENNLIDEIKVDNQPEPRASSYTKAYVLIEGDWFGGVMEDISLYNPSTSTTTPNYFSTVNGEPLGDTGNDLILFGSKLYAVVSG